MCDKSPNIIKEWYPIEINPEPVVIPFTNCAGIITNDKESVLFRTLRLQKENKKEQNPNTSNKE